MVDYFGRQHHGGGRVAGIPHAVLSERLIGYVLDRDRDGGVALRAWLRDGGGISANELERAINPATYGVRENLETGRH